MRTEILQAGSYFGSGITIDPSFMFVLYDFFDQVVTSSNMESGIITSLNANVTIETQSKTLSQKGVFELNETVLVGLPGSSGALQFTAVNLDQDKHLKATGSPY